MPTTLEQQKRRGQVADELKAITGKAKAENRRLTPEESESVTALLSEANSLADAIKAANNDAELFAQVDGLAADVAKSAGTRSSGSGPRVVKEAWEDDPKGGFKSEREFFSSVMYANRKMDNRLRPLATAGSDEQSTASDPYGGFLVPSGFLPELLMRDAEADPTAPYTRKIPMANPVVKLPARVDTNHTASATGGFRVYRKAESTAATSSRATFEQIELRAHTQFGLTYATEEVLQDSAVSFLAMVNDSYRQEFAAASFQEKLRGSGVGAFLGVLSSPALVTVSKESGQSGTIVLANLLKMRARCYGYSRAIWLANYDTLPQLAQIALSTSSIPLFMTSARDDLPDMLFGRPIFFTEYCSTLASLGDLILCDWSQVLEAEYQPMQNASSMHVRFVEHEQAFKFWRRNDCRPWWTAALTPNKGNNTLSPYVTLEAR